ncbi:MAG: hypothetical protein EOP78_19200, partial [Variovorax sp.]
DGIDSPRSDTTRNTPTDDSWLATKIAVGGVLRVVSERGLSIPSDLSLLFYEDSPWFEWQRPAISVVDSGAADMANLAVDRLMSRLGGVANSGREYRIGSRLVERASCRALPAS